MAHENHKLQVIFIYRRMRRQSSFVSFDMNSIRCHEHCVMSQFVDSYSILIIDYVDKETLDATDKVIHEFPA